MKMFFFSLRKCKKKEIRTIERCIEIKKCTLERLRLITIHLENDIDAMFRALCLINVFLQWPAIFQLNKALKQVSISPNP